MTLTTTSAIDLAADIRSGQRSAEEVMQSTLDRIAAVNPDLNAVVAMHDPDTLLAEARACDQGPNRGPLHGLPIAVKDLVNVKDLPTSMGSPIFADTVAKSDDMLAARMRAAGAILIGKTNVPEFGLGSHTFNPVYGATGNPYAPALSCGGSSGGAAVALATGMVPLADGSDMMGSLRNPAGWSNVYGFRPSWGRVPSEPLGDTFVHQMATLGPMARSPADIALLLDVIAQPDPRQPYSGQPAPVAPLRPADPKGMRIGWLGDWGGAFPMDPGINEQTETALKVFETLGAHVEVVAPPFDAEVIWDSWITLRSWQLAGALAEFHAKHPELMKDSAIWEVERGLAFSGTEIHRATVQRSDWFRTASALFDSYDALILPCAQVWPFDLNTPYPKEIAGVQMDTYHRWMHVVVPVSLLGLPALSIPAGFGQNGLPSGAQLIGRRDCDAEVLALGEAYHQATLWPQTRPAMAG